MATALTQAQNPGAQIGDINTSLASLGKQLTDAVNGASFNGLNILNGSQNTLSFVAGFNASATGGSIERHLICRAGAYWRRDHHADDDHDTVDGLRPDVARRHCRLSTPLADTSTNTTRLTATTLSP